MEKSCCTKEEAKKYTENPEGKGTSMRSYIILILFGLLFVFSVFQAIQISDIKESFASGQSALYPAVRAQAPQPSRQQAPVMVGGC